MSLFLASRRLRHLSTTAATTSTHAFDPILRRLVRSGDLAAVETHINQSQPKQPLTEPNLSSLLISYASSGLLDRALSLLSSASAVGPTSVSFNSLLSACNHHPKLFRSVPDLFSSLPKQHPSICPDKVSYGILIKSHCKARDASHCFKILKEMQDKKVEITTVHYTTILDSLYKEKKVLQAEKLWKEMMEKGAVLDVAAYNVRVMHKALSGGRPEPVLKILEEMENAGLKPDAITYNYLIACYCENRMFKEAKRVYEELERKGCRPNFRTFKVLMMALCKNGDLDGALAVFNDAVKEKKVPDLGAVKMLVKKLVEAKKMRAAKRVVTGLRKKFAEDFTGGWLELEKMVGLSKDDEEEDVKVVAA